MSEELVNRESQHPLAEQIKKAALHLQQGGLVAFPTETVYGLGGDALNKKSVANIYKAKGRPDDNPLIVHIANADDFFRLSHGPPPYAQKLIDCFWPGALTLVASKNPELPGWFGVHPDLESKTVGIRMPSHPVALSLIKESGCFVAAPSANIAGKPSSTSQKHIFEDFPEYGNYGIFVLDGGRASLGLESTVVDVTGEKPVILRPGAVSACAINDAVGALGQKYPQGEAPRSPGMKYKHYAPKAPVTVIDGTYESTASFLGTESGKVRFGAIVLKETYGLLPEDVKDMGIFFVTDTNEYAKDLYDNLRGFDDKNVQRIYAQSIPETGIGVAVMDRLRKASEGRIKYV